MLSAPQRVVTLLLLLIATSGHAAFASDASEREDAQHIVHILAYVSTDYSGAVSNGQVLQPSEYAEQQEFVSRASQLLTTLPGIAQEQNVGAAMQALTAAVAHKAPVDEVRAQATLIRKALLKHYHLHPCLFFFGRNQYIFLFLPFHFFSLKLRQSFTAIKLYTLSFNILFFYLFYPK